MFSQEFLKKSHLQNTVRAVLLISICLLVFGVYQLVNTPNEEKEPILVEETSEPQENVVAEIAGAIKYPGVYRLKKGSRVIDLVKTAGGITNNADFLKVSKELNMATILKDEDRVFISFGSISEQGVEQSSNKVSLNSASQSQLEELEGIGEKRASEIILQRPYQSLSDLLEKKVVSETLWENIKDYIKL